MKSLLFVLAVALSCTTARAALIQWPVAQGGNGHYYEIVSAPDGIAWTDARAAAEARGGYLATITSAAEDAFVFGIIGYPQHFASGHSFTNMWGPWLGGFQPDGAAEPAGDWQWVTGEPFTYTNWRSPNPSDTFSNEDYLNYLAGDGLWNDIANEGAYGGTAQVNVPIIAYAVEYNTPEPATLALITLGALMIRKHPATVPRRT